MSRLGVFKIIFFLFCISACTRQESRDATLKFQLPESLQKSSFTSKVGSLSTYAWGLSDPGELGDINCYAVLISKSQEESKNTCLDSTNSSSFAISQAAGLYPAGSQVEVVLNSGPSQTIYLLGLKSTGACGEALTKSLDLSQFSHPFVISKKMVSISPGINVVNMTASLSGSQKIKSCDGPTVSFGETLVLPTVSISSPAAGSTVGNNLVMSGSCSEEGADVAISGDASATTSCSSHSWSVSLDISSLGDGTVDFTVDHLNSTGTAAITASRSFIKNTAASLVLSDGPTYHFPSATIGNFTTQPFTLTNQGETSTALSPQTLSGAFSFPGGNFPGSGGDCTSTLAAQQSCTIVVQFLPTAAGSFTGSLAIDYSEGTVSLALEGFGLSPALLTVNPSTFNFGQVQQSGSGITASFAVTNGGGSPATALDFGTLTSSFNLMMGDCTGSLAPGNTCHFDVTFVPTTTGPFPDTLSLGYNNGNTNQSVDLSLNGEGAEIQITLSNLTISNVGKNNFDVSVDFSGDENNNATANLYYCNETDSPGCNPLSGSLKSLTRGSGKITGTVTGLIAPYDTFDTLRAKVVVNDPDGTVGSLSTPVFVLASTFLSVSSGGSHTCGITPENKLKCWGNNTYGQLGNNSTVNSSTGVIVDGSQKWVFVDAGENSTCAIDMSSKAYCWGNNASGQLGNNATANSEIPALVVGGYQWSKVSVGVNHACGLTTDGKVYCWGNNTYGQLGDGTTTQRLSPVLLSGVSQEITDVSVGKKFSCALREGTVGLCWGDNSYGQLGIGSSSPSTSPTPMVLNGMYPSLISVGGDHGCAFGEVGGDPAFLYCWGNGLYGQLGNGSSTSYSGIISIQNNDTDWVQFSLGTAHSCAIKSNSGSNDLYCWGSNSYGQVGDGSGSNALSPVQISALSGQAQVSAGGDHTCSIGVQDQTLHCWGSNSSGELGDGTTVDKTTPVHISP